MLLVDGQQIDRASPGAAGHPSAWRAERGSGHFSRIITLIMRINHITTEYDQAEDRVRLAIASTEKQTYVLWLTRRLTERLVPVLVKDLKVELGDEEATPSDLQAAQLYAQLEARISKKPAKSVAVDAGASQGLVHEMKIKSTANGMRVIEFHCKDMEVAELVVKPAELRQWLEALRQAFVNGQWRNDVWPAWLQGKPRSKA
jgi:hypothetical protein